MIGTRNKNRKQGFPVKKMVLYSMMVLLIISSVRIHAEDVTTLTITSSNTTVEKNEPFFSLVSIDQSEPVIVVQIDLSYDATMLQCNAVTNANPSVWGSFFPPTIDNEQGLIHGACVAVLGSNVADPTACFNVSFTALNTDGVSTLKIGEVIITNATGVQLTALSLMDDTITVGNGTQDDSSPHDDDSTSDESPVDSHSEVPTLQDDLTGPTQLVTNTSYRFSVTAIDADNDDLYYHVDWNDTTPVSWEGPYPSATPCILSHQWVTPGSYEITVRVKDSYGHETEELSSIQVTVDQQASNQSAQDTSPHADFTYSLKNPRAGETITFQDASFDEDGTITKRFWEYGDNTTSSAQIVEHTYATAGTYTVRLTVWDDTNYINTTSKYLVVMDAQPSASTDDSDQSTPGFEVIGMITALLFVLVLIKKFD